MKEALCVALTVFVCAPGCSSDASSPESTAPGTGGTTAGGAPSTGGSGAGGLIATGGGTASGGSVGAGGAAPNAGGASSTGGAGAGGLAGTGGTGTSTGGSGTGGAAPDSGGPTECPRTKVTGDQVVFIGDSFLAAPTSNIAPELQALWKAEGSPAYSASPRYHQLVGTNMDQIAAQYATARQQNPDIKAVIANGGGNNVLIYDRSCLTQAPPANAGCKKTVDDALALADTMMAKMVSDGVQHVVFFFYPHEPTSGLYQGTAPAINQSLDYAEPLARAVCEKHSICLFVSLREATGDPIGSGYTDRGLINPNDVHPSLEGSKFFARAIWTKMKEHCVLTP